MKNYKRLVFFYSIFYFFLFISSCKSEQIDKQPEINYQPNPNNNFFTPLYLINQSFYSISFPSWFNEVIIDNKSIQLLNVTSFQATPEVKDSMLTTSDFEFNFDKAGHISKMITQHYYDGVALGKETFKYTVKPDEYGYSLPVIAPRKSFITTHKKEQLFDMIIELEVYDRWEKAASNNKTLLFKNTLRSNEDMLAFVLDTTSWNVVYIDELIKKTGTNTIFCYGSPNQPRECFQLNNLVEKTNRKSTLFYNNGYPKKTNTEHGTFNHIKRYFYDSIGRFEYALENIFAFNGTYIEQKKYSVKYNSNNLPKNFLIFSGVDSLDLKQQTKLDFTYRFTEGK